MTTGSVVSALAIAATCASCTTSNESGTDETSEDLLAPAGLSDLVESAVSLTPDSPGGTDLTRAAGQIIDASDTVANQVSTQAGPSTTRYYLANSSGALLPKNLGNRSVPAVDMGVPNTGSPSPQLVVPAGISDGDYTVVACADALRAVAESKETNNCTTAKDSGGTSYTVHVASPDLVATVSAPSSATLGVSFSITVNTDNIGGAAPATSTVTKFYLSTYNDGTHLGKLLGSRTVSTYPDSVMPSVTLPKGTMGPVYIVACADRATLAADGLNPVGESNETNNCSASAGITVLGADLIVEFLSVSWTSSALTIHERTHNQGTATSGVTSKTYYDVTDNGVALDERRCAGGANDTALCTVATDCPGGKCSLTALRLLPNCALGYWDTHGDVPALPPNGSEVTVNTTSMFCGRRPDADTIYTLSSGAHDLYACADKSNAVPELDEANNCVGPFSFIAP